MKETTDYKKIMKKQVNPTKISPIKRRSVKLVPTSVKALRGAARQAAAASELGKEGYERFGLSKGGTLEEYTRGARVLISRSKELEEEYIKRWEEERRKNIIAYNNVIKQINENVIDSIGQLHEDTRYLRDYLWQGWLEIRELLTNVDQSTAVRMGKYLSDEKNYQRFQKAVFSVFYGSDEEIIEKQVKSGTRSLILLFEGFKDIKDDNIAFKIALFTETVNSYEDVDI